jgi:hypothetical protein
MSHPGTKLFIVGDETSDGNAVRLSKVADMLGIDHHLLCDLSEDAVNMVLHAAEKYPICVALSNHVFARVWHKPLIQAINCSNKTKGSLKSLLIYDFTRNERLGPPFCHIKPVRFSHNPGSCFGVTNQARSITKQLSGLSFRASGCGDGYVFHVSKDDNYLTPLIYFDRHPFLLLAQKGSCRVFICGSNRAVDVGENSPTEFTYKDVFQNLIPYLLFLKYSLPEQCWRLPMHAANLIVDDPPLKSRYGFLDLQQLSEVLKTNDLAATIAFIPWNYRRTSKSVAKLFRDNVDRLSICMHGCDHTRGEFGSNNDARLTWKTEQATKRMTSHQKQFGISCDRVMVFPQGIFSTHAMNVLKRGNFSAAVNTNALADDCQYAISVANLVGPGSVDYDGFPLYTRRYPDNLQDFAMDMFLERPVLIAQHHCDFRNGFEPLIVLARKFKEIQPDNQWGTLGNIVNKGYLVRDEFSGTKQIRLLSNTVHLHNDSESVQLYRLSKLESEESQVRFLSVNNIPIKYEYDKNRIALELILGPHEVVQIQVMYKTDISAVGSYTISEKYCIASRRYLSEIRDNYVLKNSSLSHLI